MPNQYPTTLDDLSRLIKQRFSYRKNIEDREFLEAEGGRYWERLKAAGREPSRPKALFVDHWYYGKLKELVYCKMNSSFRLNPADHDPSIPDSYNHDFQIFYNNRILDKVEVKGVGRECTIINFKFEDNNDHLLNMNTFKNNRNLLGHVIFGYLDHVASKGEVILTTKWIIDAPSFMNFVAESTEHDYPPGTYYYKVKVAKRAGKCVELDPITGKII